MVDEQLFAKAQTETRIEAFMETIRTNQQS